MRAKGWVWWLGRKGREGEEEGSKWVGGKEEQARPETPSVCSFFDPYGPRSRLAVAFFPLLQTRKVVEISSAMQGE